MSEAYDAAFTDAPLPPEPVEDGALPVPDTQGGKRVTRTDQAQITRGAALFGDVAGLLAGDLPEPPRPQVLTRDDGHAIFYAGQVNALFADAESGKTMVTCAAIEEVLKVGCKAVFVDIDHNGMTGIVTRLLDLGAPADALSDPSRFRYVEPEDKAQLLDLVAFLRTWRPDLVVVDSIGELLPMFRLSSNNPDDFTTVHAEVLKPLAVSGACVITVDHVAKNTASADAGPTGTNAKRRAVGGVSIRVKVKDQFVPGSGGAVWLMVNKDRHGGLREHCPRGEREPSAGLFILTPNGSGMTWNLRAPQDSDSQHIDGVSEADLAAVDSLPVAPTSVRDLREQMNWRMERASQVLRVWRYRSPSVTGKQETRELTSVTRFRTPVSETGNSPGLRPPGGTGEQTPPVPPVSTEDPPNQTGTTLRDSAESSGCPKCGQPTTFVLTGTADGPACRKCVPGIKAGTTCRDCQHPRELLTDGSCNPCHGKAIRLSSLDSSPTTDTRVRTA